MFTEANEYQEENAFFLKLAYDIHHVESCGNPHGLSGSDDFMHFNDFSIKGIFIGFYRNKTDILFLVGIIIVKCFDIVVSGDIDLPFLFPVGCTTSY